jgi:hypothetical protein
LNAIEDRRMGELQLTMSQNKSLDWIFSTGYASTIDGREEI